METKCKCGLPLIDPAGPDPWCAGCNMSAAVCDCCPDARQGTPDAPGRTTAENEARDSPVGQNAALRARPDERSLPPGARPVADIEDARRRAERVDDLRPIGRSEWAELCRRFGQRGPIRLPAPPAAQPPSLEAVSRARSSSLALAVIVVVAVVMLGKLVTLAVGRWL